MNAQPNAQGKATAPRITATQGNPGGCHRPLNGLPGRSWDFQRLWLRGLRSHGAEGYHPFKSMLFRARPHPSSQSHVPSPVPQGVQRLEFFSIPVRICVSKSIHFIRHHYYHLYSQGLLWIMSVRRSLCNRENICDVLYDAVGGGMRAEVVRQHLSGALRREPSQAWVLSSCPAWPRSF